MSAHDLAVDLAQRFDLRKRPRSWGGNCPSCSYHSAFSIKVGKGAHPILYCSNGCTREQLDEVAQNALGNAWTPPPKPDEQDVAAARAKKQGAALRLFAGSTSLTAADPASLYLAGRGLAGFIGCPALRYRGDCWHQDGGRLPALVAQVVDATGRAIACHRTYLDRQGRKAGLDPCKMSLGPLWGGAVRLTLDGAPPPEVVVAEGIETAGSAGLLLTLPAWAAVSAGNMAAGLILPEMVRTVTIAADPDAPGRRAARDAAARWRAEGRTVRIATPDKAGADFNDLLRQRIHA
jgi:putative DNA primase/helicase